MFILREMVEAWLRGGRELGMSDHDLRMEEEQKTDYAWKTESIVTRAMIEQDCTTCLWERLAVVQSL